MLSKIYQYLIAILALGLAIMAALFYRGKAVHEKALRKGIEQVRETEKKATQALTKGLQREKKARDKATELIRSRKYFG